MRVHGAWIKRYEVLCSETDSTSDNLSLSPTCSRQVVKSSRILWDSSIKIPSATRLHVITSATLQHVVWSPKAHLKASCNGFRATGHEVVLHYIDVIMTTMASQITSLTVVNSTVYSDADQRKHQSSASLAFVWGIHRDRWIPRTNGQLRGKCFHLMTSSW